MKRRTFVLGSLCVACSADPAPPRTDAGIDARDVTVDATGDVTMVTTETVQRRAGARSLVVQTGTWSVRMTDARGAPVLTTTPGVPFFELGVVDGGPNRARYYDLAHAASLGVTWRAPVHGTRTGDGVYTFDDAETGPVTVRIAAQGDEHFTVSVDATGPDVAMVRFTLPSGDGDVWHGLGERFGAANARGEVIPMQLEPASGPSGTNEAHVPVPFTVSSRGYGMFVETHEAGTFDVASTDPERVTAAFEGGRATVHLYADTPLAVVAQYTRTTGLPRMPPAWTLGPMQWRNEWTNADEMLTDARRLRAEGIPTTTIWIDNPWQVSYSDHTVDTRRFPDPPGLMRALRDMGYRVIFWSVPYLEAVPDGGAATHAAQRLWQQARDAGHLVRLANGGTYVSPLRYYSPGGAGHGPGSLVDLTSEPARAFWSSQLEPLIALGARGFKLDYAEDIIPSVGGLRPGFRFTDGSTERESRWAFPQGYDRAYRDALDRYAMGDGFLLGRASSWGGQRHLDVVWPGDLDNDFSAHSATRVGGLPAAIHAMVSLSESGFPSFASDTGGYRGDVPTREVLLRWAEHTALSPYMQLGGGGASHNPWMYDADAVTVYRGLAQLHQDLAPYLQAMVRAATVDGTVGVRSPAMAFPEDPASARDGESYLLGDRLFVAPVVTAGATTRAVHLPPGAWVHWFTRRRFRGPTDVTVPAPLGQPPLFVRAGSTIPLTPQEVVTLAPGDGAVVDASDRARVQRVAVIAPSDDGAVTVDGTTVRWQISAAHPAWDVLRGEVDVSGDADPTSAPVREVREAGAALTRDDMAASGRCTDCWSHDVARGIVYVVTRGRGDIVITR